MRVRSVRLGGVHVQERGWGVEHWIENDERYCGKVLFVRPSKRCSMHYHMRKCETMLVSRGELELVCIDPADGREYTLRMGEGDCAQIEPGQAHQIHNPSSGVVLIVIEFSTHHEESDSYRVRKGD